MSPPCQRHVPMISILRLDRRHGMDLRSWSVCENCDAEIHRADGEPWKAYVATADESWIRDFAHLPRLILKVRKVNGGYEADLSGLIVECHDSSGIVARASSAGVTHTASTHQGAVTGAAAGFFNRLFGSFTNGPLQSESAHDNARQHDVPQPEDKA